MKAVEVRELVKDYGSFRALKGISFEVDEGEVFAGGR
jgi:ABC-type multidrug transport system ATPase subunit